MRHLLGGLADQHERALGTNQLEAVECLGTVHHMVHIGDWAKGYESTESKVENIAIAQDFRIPAGP